MNKNIIKKHLSETFLSEETKPKGLANTEKVQKQSGATNKAAMKDVEKEVKDYDDSTKTEKENADTVKKYENDSEQDDLHDLGELQNGSLAATKVNSPNDEWQERQDKAISGTDSTLGNSKDYANVVTADQAGFTGPEFGENLVNDIKKSKELRAKAEDKYNRLSTGVSGADFDDKKMNENKTTKMKKKNLIFENAFNGIETALAKIPNKYKVDSLEFNMTDGNEKYEMKWEGTLEEGRAIVLKASDKNLMTEDMAKMKHLMGYKSEDTLGLVHGAARLDEDASFNDVLNKTKALLSESEEGDTETLKD